MIKRYICNIILALISRMGECQSKIAHICRLKKTILFPPEYPNAYYQKRRIEYGIQGRTLVVIQRRNGGRGWAGATLTVSKRRTVGSGLQRAGTRPLLDGVIRGSAKAPLIADLKRAVVFMVAFLCHHIFLSED